MSLALQVSAWDISPIYLQDLCILLKRKQGVMIDLVQFFIIVYEWFYLVKKEHRWIVPGSWINKRFLEKVIQFLHLNAFQNKCLKYYKIHDLPIPEDAHTDPTPNLSQYPFHGPWIFFFVSTPQMRPFWNLYCKCFYHFSLKLTLPVH